MEVWWVIFVVVFRREHRLEFFHCSSDPHSLCLRDDDRFLPSGRSRAQARLRLLAMAAPASQSLFLSPWPAAAPAGLARLSPWAATPAPYGRRENCTTPRAGSGQALSGHRPRPGVAPSWGLAPKDRQEGHGGCWHFLSEYAVCLKDAFTATLTFSDKKHHCPHRGDEVPCAGIFRKTSLWLTV